jgi:hypothetical protein
VTPHHALEGERIAGADVARELEVIGSRMLRCAFGNHRRLRVSIAHGPIR